MNSLFTPAKIPSKAPPQFTEIVTPAPDLMLDISKPVELVMGGLSPNSSATAERGVRISDK